MAYISLDLTCGPNKVAPGNTGRAGHRQRRERPTPGGCAPSLAHGPSFGRNPKGSQDFLEYPVPKPSRQAALFWYLGSEVLGCRTLRLETLSSAGLRMQPYPRAPGHVWPGHLHGAGCLSARAMGTRFPTSLLLLPCRLSLLSQTHIPICACSPPLVAGVRGACGWVR